MSDDLVDQAYIAMPRDLFAAAALVGLLTTHASHLDHPDAFEIWPRQAYRWADAMLAAREGR